MLDFVDDEMWALEEALGWKQARKQVTGRVSDEGGADVLRGEIDVTVTWQTTEVYARVWNGVGYLSSKLSMCRTRYQAPGIF